MVLPSVLSACALRGKVSTDTGLAEGPTTSELVLWPISGAKPKKRSTKRSKPERAADSDLSAWIHLGVAAPVGCNRLALKQQRTDTSPVEFGASRARRYLRVGDQQVGLCMYWYSVGSESIRCLCRAPLLPSSCEDLLDLSGSLHCTGSSPPSSGQGNEVPRDGGEAIAGDRRATEPSESCNLRTATTLARIQSAIKM